MKHKIIQYIQLIDLNNNLTFQEKIEQELLIGRMKYEDGRARIVIDYDKEISKNHCRIFVNGSEIFIQDLGSANGTFLNGKPLEDDKLIKSGDIVDIGNVKLQIRIV